MANKGNYWDSIRGNIRELFGVQLAGWMPTLLFTLLALKGNVGTLFANHLLALAIAINRSDKILYVQDRQETISYMISVLIPNRIMRETAEKFSEETLEEVVKVQDAFRANPDGDEQITAANISIADNIIRGLFGDRGSQDMSQPHSEPNPSSGAQPTTEHAGTAATGSRHSVLHMVGTLEADDSATFWEIVAEAQKHLNEEQLKELHRETSPTASWLTLETEEAKLDHGEVPAGNEVMRLVSRVSLTKEQIAAIIEAPKETEEADETKRTNQRRDALLDALRQASSAGGLGDPFARLLDRIARLAETALPTSGSAGKLRRTMEAHLEEMMQEDGDIVDVR